MGQKGTPQEIRISGLPPISRRVRPLTVGLAVLTALALLAAATLTWVLRQNLPVPIRFTVSVASTENTVEGWIVRPPDQNSTAAAGSAKRGMLILFADVASPRVSDRLLAAALADAGFGIAVIPTIGKIGEQVPLAAVMDQVAAEIGLRASQMVIAGTGSGAERVTAALVSNKNLSAPTGLILIVPTDDRHQLAARLSVLPESVKMTIITSSEPQTSTTARELFFAASGEDATLFPGLSGTHALSAETFLSMDGQRRLVVLPAFSVLNEGWSPRLHQALQQSVMFDPAAAVADPVPIRTLYNRLLLPIWILLLLASVPLLLTLTAAAQAAAKSRSLRPDRTMALENNGSDRIIDQQTTMKQVQAGLSRSSRMTPWIELALYLPATALAIPLGRLMARLAADERLSGGYTFYALIAVYGWCFLLLHRLQRHEPADARPGGGFGAAAIARTLLFAFIFLTTVLYWMTTVFGSPFVSGSSLISLVPIALLLMPAMLPACIGYRRTRPRQRLFHSLLHLLFPAIYLAVIVLQQGSGSLMSAVSMILLLIAGRAVAKSLSWDRAPQLIASAAGALLMLLMWPLPMV